VKISFRVNVEIMQKFILITASVLGALGVAIGAFGAHAFKPLLEQYQRIDTFETGVKYHFYHTLALLAIGLSLNKVQDMFLTYSAFGMMLGILIFSGSLYLLSLFNLPKLGMVTPFGGLFLIIGWIFFAIGIYRSI
jgi:uncharacterized membrane protein YgdD (TMEM256/DUF423 family)